MNKFALLVIAAALFAGCSKNNSTEPTNNPLVGNWSIMADTARFFVNGTLTKTEILKESTSPYIQFNADGSGVLMDDTTGAGATTKFTYTVAEQTIIFNYPAQKISGVSLPAFSQTAAYNELATGKIEIVFTSSEMEGGETDSDYEVVDIAFK